MAADWYEDNAERQERKQKDQQIVAREFPTLWANLCCAIQACVNSHNKRFTDQQVSWDGPPCEKLTIPDVILLTQFNMDNPTHPKVLGSKRKQINIRADQENHCVYFKHTDPLQVGVAKEHAAFINDGNAISIDDAAEVILRDFLFSIA